MAFYRLVSQNTHDSIVDAVTFNSDSVEGEGTPEPKTVSVSGATELSEDEASRIQAAGYKLVEVEEPQGGVGGPVVGGDVVGMSPVVAGGAVSQQGMQTLQSPPPPPPPADTGVDQPQDSENPNELS